MRYRLYALIFFMILSVPRANATPRTLVIEGTGDSEIVLRQVAALYESLHPDIRVEVPESMGSGGGIKALIAGKAGLARTARPLKPREKAAQLTQVPFAWSPIVFASHPSGGAVKTITIDQVLRIYNGELSNWKALGGAEHKLYPVSREVGDSSRMVLDAYVIKGLGRSPGLGDAGKIYYSTGDTAQALKRNAFSFGYVPLSSAMASDLHVFALEGVFPGESAVTGRLYPLVTTFYLVFSPLSGPLAMDFLSFASSEQAGNKMRVMGVFSADRAF